ncbi:nose resistant to fluoxetine protein 6-like [Anneissia japonica]|uniref:nose resistant to fluoxetine protein 6-like n=1 Tax=Anneissia japonica TaxID=1529436 RepID=UPI0014259ED4|nr:nose resistant to fluoxetine protein 6-like [Anneissia japonica]
MLLSMNRNVLLLLVFFCCCHAQMQVIRSKTEALQFIAKQRYRYNAKAEELQAIVQDLVLQPLLYSTQQLVSETALKDQAYVTNESPTEKSKTTSETGKLSEEITKMTVTNLTVKPMIVTNITMETTMMTATNTAMKAKTMTISSEITEKPASQCLVDLETFQSDILVEEHYAQMMLDSFGKLPPGILQGNILWLGLYDQCLKQSREVNDHQANFTAQYCVVSLIKDNNPQPILNVGVCVPDSCNSADLMELLNINNESNITVSVMCHKEFDYSSGAIACLTLLAFLGCLILVGTAIESFNKYKEFEIENEGFERLASKNQSILTDNEQIKTIPLNGPIVSGKNNGFFIQFLLCFSLLNNGSKILKAKQGEISLGALNGFRVLSLWWVILGHSYGFGVALLANPTKIVDVLSRFTFQAVGNATFSVDSFFFLSGLLVTYLTLNYLRNNNGKLNWVMFYVHRYLRLTPVYMLVIFIFTTLTPYFATGPLYSYIFDPNPAPGVDTQITLCQDYWWTNLLYINNLYPQPIQKQCLDWGWYLANDMQFFIISPFIIYLLYHYFFAGIAAWCILLLTCFSSLIGETIKHDVTTEFFPEDPTQIYFVGDAIYVQPWTRISTYLVGMAVGYILYKYRGRVRMSLFVTLLGWVTATVTGLAVVYGLYGNFHGNHLSKAGTVVYITLCRFAWAIAVAWVVFACTTGYGGPVNSLLSWSAWVPLARISYCAYLLHPIIMFVFSYSLPTTVYFSDFLMVYFFLGHLVISYAGAFVLSVCAEAPFMALEKLLLKRDKSV